LEIDSLQWKKWFNEEKAEVADLPKAYKEIGKFHRLLLLRAMRPDRLTSALVKPGETLVEARRDTDVQIVLRTWV